MGKNRETAKKREKFEQMVKEAKVKTVEKFGIEMESEAAGNAHMLYHTFRVLRSKRKIR